MEIIAALFIESIDVRQVAGPSARLDLTGAHFSAAPPEPFPLTWAPHLVAIVHAPEDDKGEAVLEVIFKRDGEQVARNVQPLQVEPSKFSYRLVRAELEFTEPGTIFAHCRLDMGPETVVPFTMLEAPAGEDDPSDQ